MIGPLLMTEDRGRALALLRIYVGIVWLTYGTSKFYAGWVGGRHDFASAVASAASTAPPAIQSLLASLVIPHQALFGDLIAYGETLVGISLLFGIAVRAGALGGMFLSLTYFIVTGRFASHYGFESIELLLFAMCAALFFRRPMAWSVDRLLRDRRSQH